MEKLNVKSIEPTNQTTWVLDEFEYDTNTLFTINDNKENVELDLPLNKNSGELDMVDFLTIA